ncbi:MAG: PASTA domain-containing protein, partial [Oscillospiraceae bacterium]|nr:PASTA domain-containing protein [Oscillospiraceae bacterium]
PSIVFEYKYLSEKTQYFNASAVSRAAAEAEYSRSLPLSGNNKEAVKQVRTRTKVREELDEYDDYDDYGEDEKPSKSSYFVVVLTAIAAGIIIIVVAFIAIMLYGTIIDKPQPIGKMPPLINYEFQEVKSAYANQFDVVVIEEQYSSEYPEGAIIEQNPAEGSEYLVGNTTVKVKISKGPRMVTVSNVYDLASNDALNILKENDKFNVVIYVEFSDTVPKDNVIMTDPAKGEKVPYGSEVKMYVSKGPEEQEVSVPQCVGYTLEEAEQLLNGKFTIQTMTADSLEEEGTVIEQSIPAVGEDGQPNIVKLNTTIILTLSTGNMPETEAVITFRVPDNIRGAADFNCYVNGQIIGTTPIDNLAYASTVSVTVKGTEMQKVILEAVNRDTKESETIGEYSVDFVENNVTEVKFESSKLRALFTDEEVTEPISDPFTEPNEIIGGEGDETDIDDEAFWHQVFGY